jgi:hypothetical protein
MWQYLYNIERMVSNTIRGFDSREWLIFLGIVVVVGIFCMRGYGSRRNY